MASGRKVAAVQDAYAVLRQLDLSALWARVSRQPRIVQHTADDSLRFLALKGRLRLEFGSTEMPHGGDF